MASKDEKQEDEEFEDLPSEVEGCWGDSESSLSHTKNKRVF
jgi:hypothetical protein